MISMELFKTLFGILATFVVFTSMIVTTAYLVKFLKHMKEDEINYKDKK